MPAHDVTLCPHVEHFTCVVKMLYNLQYTQVLATLSTKFSPEEKQAWVSSGALKKVKFKSHIISITPDAVKCLFNLLFVFILIFSSLHS